MCDLPETELLKRSKRADPEAMGELFRRHYGYSIRVATGILRQPDDAQDAVQVAYFTAFRSLRKFRGDSSFKTWMTRIVVNCCLLRLRDARRQLNPTPIDSRDAIRKTEQLPSNAPSPETSAWSRELNAALSTALSKLPSHLREPYMMFAIAGLSLQEVADATGLSVSGAKTRLFRARAGLRKSLAPVWADRPVRRQAAA
jgi:RNA polymerase sigma-70 factor (ECF subfamily)